MNESPMERRADVEEAPVESRKVRIPNRLGLHARPAAELVKLAGTFKAKIQLTKDGLQVNGKSIMGVLMLAAEQGTELLVEACGSDASEAADAIEALIQRGFGER